MRTFTTDEIEAANQRGRSDVSRRENNEHRRIEDAARAQRLLEDKIIVLGLRLLRREALQRTGAAESVPKIDAILARYAYLDGVPSASFSA